MNVEFVFLDMRFQFVAFECFFIDFVVAENPLRRHAHDSVLCYSVNGCLLWELTYLLM